MTRSFKIALAMVAVTVVVLVGIVVVSNLNRPDVQEAAPEAAANAQLVRDDSPRLSDGPDAQFVEFLDFECEACIAVYPVINDMKDKYGDRIEFVVRHMPLHGNSMGAAKASEAAADQGKFEEMYNRLFQTAESWGHTEADQREVFFGFAEDLGLDMDKFAASYDDPATLARIEQSQSDARALGVTGTPTFFLDGERVEPRSVEDLENAFEQALND